MQRTSQCLSVDSRIHLQRTTISKMPLAKLPNRASTVSNATKHSTHKLPNLNQQHILHAAIFKKPLLTNQRSRTPKSKNPKRNASIFTADSLSPSSSTNSPAPRSARPYSSLHLPHPLSSPSPADPAPAAAHHTRTAETRDTWP
jgi:hypothetical protein